MLNVYMLPTPKDAANNITNSINQIVTRLEKLLPDYGVQLVNTPDNADLLASHAGQSDPRFVCDVAHLSGLYPTALHSDTAWHWAMNGRVIESIRQARAVTVPSEWVADILRRDMHIQPHVIGWGVDTEEWTPSDNHGYVLWNKTRADSVCDPRPVTELAKRFPQIQFVTTFATPDAPSNVKAIGLQSYEAMRDIVRHAAVYLATTKETFGIGTLEAMAAGVPVLGYQWGATPDIITHGVNGFLGAPHDYDALESGLRYILDSRTVLGNNARLSAAYWSWDRVARDFATLYKATVNNYQPQNPRVSVVIPCHNYGRYVGQAIDSVLNQETDYEFEVVCVADRCTDDSVSIIESYGSKVRVHISNYGSPALARNHGISHAKGDYVVCLDADDKLGAPAFLQTLSDALDADRTLGIVFTGIQMMDAEGNLGSTSMWPRGYDYDQQLVRKNQVPTCCMFRKEAWKRTGGYRPEFEPAEDAEFWLRIGAIGYRARQVTQEGWFVYRLHSNSLSATVRKGQRKEPDWTAYHTWIKDGQRPFAADGKPPLHSWAVRNYDTPDVSVIIPVGAGHEVHLRRALDTVEAQTYRNWECIVINDTGHALNFDAHPFVKEIKTRGKIGAGAARNLGARHAKAPMLAFLDADDWLDPRFLDATLNQWRMSGRYVYTDWISVNKDGVLEQNTTFNYDFDIIFKRTAIHAVNILIPKADFLALGGFDEGMIAWEDVDFFMKAAVKGFCGVRCPEALFTYDYRSGKRRELGESVKAELKAFLATRYGDYMRGVKVCACNEPPKGKAAKVVNGITPPADEKTAADMVLAVYTSPRAGSAPAPAVGAITKQSYGLRAKGDMFYIWRKDLDNHLFKEATRLDLPKAQTVIPPPPVKLGELVTA